MFTAEHTNFLLQCCKRRRFRDGARFLARPLRATLYRLRRRAARPAAAAGPARMDDLGGESVDGCVHGVFVPLPVAGAALGCDARLMAEVDGQVLGVCRLAGGGYFRRKPGEAASLAVRALPDAEDRHCLLYTSRCV